MGTNPPSRQDYPPPPGGQGFPPSGNVPIPNYPPPPYTPIPNQYPQSPLPSTVQRHPGTGQPEQGQAPQFIYIEAPPQLPPLVKGQRIKSGPYSIMVTDDMVRQRERENQELYRNWLAEQQRRNRTPEEIERERQEQYTEQFKHAQVRRNFIKKVYCILTMQLSFTAAFISLVVFDETVRMFMMQHWYLLMLAVFVWFCTYYAIFCYEYIRRQSPCNAICLILLTISLAYITAHISARYKTEIVLFGFGITAAVAVIISLMAVCCKLDFTKQVGLIMVVSLVIMVIVFMMIIILLFTRIRVLQAIIGGLMALLMSLYLYFDTQSIMGGRTIELNPDEVVLAATQLYVDIILLYQYVLCCVGGTE